MAAGAAPDANLSAEVLAAISADLEQDEPLEEGRGGNDGQSVPEPTASGDGRQVVTRADISADAPTLLDSTKAGGSIATTEAFVAVPPAERPQRWWQLLRRRRG